MSVCASCMFVVLVSLELLKVGLACHRWQRSIHSISHCCGNCNAIVRQGQGEHPSCQIQLPRWGSIPAAKTNCPGGRGIPLAKCNYYGRGWGFLVAYSNCHGVGGISAAKSDC